MVIKPRVCRIFLICSNVLLLSVGLALLILGFKMQRAFSMLSVIDIPLVKNAVNSAIAAGVLIFFCSVTGIFGGCDESQRFILLHLVSLGVIVILEFSVGVTLLMIKKSVSTAVVNCNNQVCTAAFDAAILDYALPSAGLMMSVIFVEAVMIYSSIRLYLFIRDKPSSTVESGSSTVEPNVHMQNVAGIEAAFFTQPQTTPAFQTEYTAHHSQLSSLYQGSFRRSQSNIEERPPDYNSLFQLPQYLSEVRYTTPSASTSAELPKDTDDDFNLV